MTSKGKKSEASRIDISTDTSTTAVTTEEEDTDQKYIRANLVSKHRSTSIKIDTRKYRWLLVVFALVTMLVVAGFCYAIYYYRQFGWPPTTYSKGAYKATVMSLVSMMIVVPMGFYILKMGITNMLIGFIYMFLLILCIWNPAKAIKNSILCLTEDNKNTIKYYAQDPDKDKHLHPFWDAIQRKYNCCGTVDIDRVNDWPHFLNGTNLPQSCCSHQYLEKLKKDRGLSDAPESNERLKLLKANCGTRLARTTNRGAHYRPKHVFNRMFSGFQLSLTEVELKAMEEKFSAIINPERFLIDKFDNMEEEVKTMPVSEAFRQIWKSYYMDYVCNAVENKRQIEAELNKEYLKPHTGKADTHGFIPCEDLTVENQSDLIYPGDWNSKSPAESVGWIKSFAATVSRCIIQGEGSIHRTKVSAAEREKMQTTEIPTTEEAPTTEAPTPVTKPTPKRPNLSTKPPKNISIPEQRKPDRTYTLSNGSSVFVQGEHKGEILTEAEFLQKFKGKMKKLLKNQNYSTTFKKIFKGKVPNFEFETWSDAVWINVSDVLNTAKVPKERDIIRDKYQDSEKWDDEFIDLCITPFEVYELAFDLGFADNEPCPSVPPEKCGSISCEGDQRRRRRSIRSAPIVRLGRIEPDTGQKSPSTTPEPDTGETDNNFGGVTSKNHSLNASNICNKNYPKSRRNATTLGRELLLVLDYLTSYIYELGEEKDASGKVELKNVPKGTYIIWPVPTQNHPKDLYPYKLAANLGRVPNNENAEEADKLAKKMYYISRGITENLLLEGIVHERACETLHSEYRANLKDKLAHDANQRFLLWGPQIHWRNSHEGLGHFFYSFLQQLAWVCILVALGIISFVLVIAFVFWQYYSRIKKEEHADLALPEEFFDKDRQREEDLKHVVKMEEEKKKAEAEAKKGDVAIDIPQPAKIHHSRRRKRRRYHHHRVAPEPAPEPEGPTTSTDTDSKVKIV